MSQSSLIITLIFFIQLPQTYMRLPTRTALKCTDVGAAQQAPLTEFTPRPQRHRTRASDMDPRVARGLGLQEA